MTFMMYVISLLIVYFLVYIVLKNKFNIQIITKGFFLQACQQDAPMVRQFDDHSYSCFGNYSISLF